MSRRDTIIIAVLLNAGLLIVLFATSLKSDVQEVQPQTLAIAPMEAAKAEPVSAHSGVDEVDQALKQYVPIAATTESKQSFAADLQSIGTLESKPLQTPSENTPLLTSVPAPVAEAEPTYREVKVKKGDVLERIARQNRVSVEDLMKANHLGSTRLKIGQVLKIPSKQKSVPTPAAESGEGKFYIVKHGDNPWTIAVKNHMKVEDLLQLNNLDEQQAKRLKPGDKLKIK
jgi:peptidoglycan endopeptidase LytF